MHKLIVFLLFSFAYCFVVHKHLTHLFFFQQVVSKLVFLLFDMANTSSPLQCPCLIKNNYEIGCICVKTWLYSQDVWETVEKSFEESLERATLTST